MSSLSIFLRLALGNNLLDILAAAFEYRSRLNRRVDGFSWSENLSASLTLEAASFYSREESWASSLLAKQSETIKYHPFVSRVVFMYIEKWKAHGARLAKLIAFLLGFLCMLLYSVNL